VEARRRVRMNEEDARHRSTAPGSIHHGNCSSGTTRVSISTAGCADAREAYS